MLTFALQLHILHHNVVDFTQRRAVFQHLPRFVRVEVNLNQFIVPHCQQTVAPKMLHKVVVDGVFIQIMPLKEQLGVIAKFGPNYVSFAFINVSKL